MYKTYEEAKEKNPDCTRFVNKKVDGEYFWFALEGGGCIENANYGKDFYAGVVSPHDGYVFKSKKDYNEYLKKNNFVLTQ